MAVRRGRLVEQMCNRKETTWFENHAVRLGHLVQSESRVESGIGSRSEVSRASVTIRLASGVQALAPPGLRMKIWGKKSSLWLYVSPSISQTYDKRCAPFENEMFVYFLINKRQYVRRDTNSLFPSNKDQEVRGCKLLLGGCLFACGMVMSRRLVSYQQSWSNVKMRDLLSVMLIGRASAVFDLVRNATRDGSLCFKLPESTDFKNFYWPFYSHAWDQISSEKLLGGKVHGWLKKRTFLIENLFLHFNRMDARNLPAQRRVLFLLVQAIFKTTSG